MLQCNLESTSIWKENKVKYSFTVIQVSRLFKNHSLHLLAWMKTSLVITWFIIVPTCTLNCLLFGLLTGQQKHYKRRHVCYSCSAWSIRRLWMETNHSAAERESCECLYAGFSRKFEFSFSWKGRMGCQKIYHLLRTEIIQWISWPKDTVSVCSHFIWFFILLLHVSRICFYQQTVVDLFVISLS